VTTTPETGRRRYDGTLRRARAAETREPIVTAGVDLVRAASIRDWRSVTVRAVAERAGVNERTVYRHFTGERELRDAVMQRLEDDAGIDLDSMTLGEVDDVAARIFRHVADHPRATRRPLDPTLVEANRRQHDALLTAVSEHAVGWSAADRRLAAAALDVLWSVAAYERLAVDWELEPEEAVRAVTWVIGLVETAIRDGRRPPRASRRSASG